MNFAEVERISSSKPKTFLPLFPLINARDAQQPGYLRVKRTSRGTTTIGGCSLGGKLMPFPFCGYARRRLKVEYRRATPDRRKLEVTARSTVRLRNTKSPFSAAIINNKPNFGNQKFREVQSARRSTWEQGEVYWFETVEFEKAGSMKFRHLPKSPMKTW